MLPPLRQRLVLLISCLLGGAVLLACSGPLRSVDSHGGISLLWARVAAPWAVGVLVLGLLPGAAAGLLATATGHRLAGMFVMGVALTALAAHGGAIDGWLRRVELPGAYAGLCAELLLWQVLILGVYLMTGRWGPALCCRLPGWLRFGDPHDDEPLDRAAADARKQSLAARAAPCVLSAVMATGIAAALAFVLIRSSDVAQVTWSLSLAFIAAGLCTHTALRGKGTLGLFLAPAMVALIGYALVLSNFDHADAFLAALFNRHRPLPDRVPPLALALPIHYFGAGTMGLSIGAAWAHGIVRSGKAAIARAAA